MLREIRHGVLDRRLEMHHIARQRTGQQGPQIIVDHDFLRASTMMVDPARHTASSSVNGSRRGHQRGVQQIFQQPLRADVSAILRIRRAMGSSLGARLVANPAGLSRSEKCLCRSTSNPQLSSSRSRSEARKSVR